MRLAALFLMPVCLAAPAVAQTRDCEASAAGKVGEIAAVQPVDLRTGKAVGAMSITWGLERKGGFADEAASFSRPALMLDFRTGGDGGLLGPTSAFVSITRYQDASGKTPGLAGVKVRATPKGGAALTWPADKPGDGPKKLADRLRETWPDQLQVELLGAGDKVLADTVFFLNERPDADTLARKVIADAKAKCG